MCVEFLVGVDFCDGDGMGDVGFVVLVILIEVGFVVEVECCFDFFDFVWIEIFGKCGG